jgi:hypothetical protein
MNATSRREREALAIRALAKVAVYPGESGERMELECVGEQVDTRAARGLGVPQAFDAARLGEDSQVLQDDRGLVRRVRVVRVVQLAEPCLEPAEPGPRLASGSHRLRLGVA